MATYDRGMHALDLSRTSVFLDFDGTVTEADVGRHLLDSLASADWEQLSDDYRRGVIGSRECLIGQWALLPPDEGTLRATAAEVPLDPGFLRLVAALREAGADVTVVSDGFGFRAEQVCEEAGVPVLTNHVDWATGRLEFPHAAGRTTVLVGDGTSDHKAALLADVIFAKRRLAAWCDMFDVPYHPFATLPDVQAALVP